MFRRRWLKVLVLMILAVLALAAAAASSIAINFATTESAWLPPWFDIFKSDPFWVVVAVLVVASIVAAILVIMQESAAGAVQDPPPPSAQPIPGWVVPRPKQLRLLVKAICGRRTRTVAVTTALTGAGGFGKTVLAGLVAGHWRVRRRFHGRVYWMTLGRDATDRDALALKVNELVMLITGDNPGFTDPQSAGMRLGQVLDGRRRMLLIIDDVWNADQLEPFLMGGPHCSRLVTTRVAGVVPDAATRVVVDAMTAEQARTLLTWQLPAIGPAAEHELLQLTGRWALLVHLVNRAVSDLIATGLTAADAAEQVASRLRSQGPTATDRPGLDLSDPRKRARAVRATIEASSTLLPAGGSDRLAELGVFAEDEVIPVDLVLTLWRGTAGLTDEVGRDLCLRMSELSLISLMPDQGGTISLHDVVRDFFRIQLGADGLRTVNSALTGALRGTLPVAMPLAPGLPSPRHAWWQSAPSRYLRYYLISHLLTGNKGDEAEALAGDLRWVLARAAADGIAGTIGDLARTEVGNVRGLVVGLRRAGLVVAQQDPPDMVADTLLSRLRDDVAWAPQVDALDEAHRGRPRLVNSWPLPDHPEPAAWQTLSGRNHIWGLAISPDGRWLAAVDGHAVLSWELPSGMPRTWLTGEFEDVRQVVISPDGSWIAVGGSDPIHIWDGGTGLLRAVGPDESRFAYGLTAGPDGSWLASVTDHGALRLWDPSTASLLATFDERAYLGASFAVSPDGAWFASVTGFTEVSVVRREDGAVGSVLRGHSDFVNGVAISPDGTDIVTVSSDATARIWTAATGMRRIVLTGHRGSVNTVAISPDGEWLATGGADHTVRIWNLGNGRSRAVLTGHTGRISAIAVSPDGKWLATAGADHTVRIWDAGFPVRPGDRHGHDGRVLGVIAASAGDWLASAGEDGTVRIWDTKTGEVRRVLDGHVGAVNAVSAAPDGTWLASAGDDRTVRIWDVAAGVLTANLIGHEDRIRALAIAPSGSWLATAGDDGTVRIWNVEDGTTTDVFTDHTGPVCVCIITPDGGWLATAGQDGIRIWDRRTGARKEAVKRPICACAVSPDGSWLAAADHGVIHIWQPGNGTQRTVASDHLAGVTGLAFSPDGRHIASVSSDATISVRDSTNGELVTRLRAAAPLTGVAWSSTGHLAVSGDQGVYLMKMLPSS